VFPYNERSYFIKKHEDLSCAKMLFVLKDIWTTRKTFYIEVNGRALTESGGV